MYTVELTIENTKHIKEAADLLRQVFPHSYMDCAEEEVLECLEKENVLIAAIEEDVLIGFIGARPQYGITGWELHPLLVSESYRSNGIGTTLCIELENLLREKGCLTIYLGSDDETDSTSLSNTNLFEDTFQKIENIKNLKNHPFEFYQKLGYKIVGVIPDANGIGKPDIMLAKGISNR